MLGLQMNDDATVVVVSDRVAINGKPACRQDSCVNIGALEGTDRRLLSSCAKPRMFLGKVFDSRPVCGLKHTAALQGIGVAGLVCTLAEAGVARVVTRPRMHHHRGIPIFEQGQSGLRALQT